MKITFLLPKYPTKPVGGFRVVYEYANQLVRRGHEVYVVHLQSIPDQSFLKKIKRRIKFLFKKVNIYWHPIDGRVHLIFAPNSSQRYIPDSDAIFATSWQTAFLVNEYPISKGKKFHLIQGYVPDGKEEELKKAWFLPLKKVLISKWLYEKALEMGISEEDIVYIPNAINHEIFRLKIPIEEREEVVCMMFSPSRIKRGKEGLKVIENVKKIFPKLNTILFGRGERPSYIPDWIEYHRDPPITELVDIYNRSSIYLCPSLIEGWALPPAEASSCGCAIISTDNKGIRDYVTHGKTGLISNSFDELSAYLYRLCIDKELRIRLAKEGIKNIRRFSWKDSAKRLEEWILKNL